MSIANPSKGSNYRNWLWLPISLVCIGMIFWGVIGTHWVVAEPTLDNNKNKTGNISAYNKDAMTFTLTTEKGDIWNVSFKESTKMFVIETNGDQKVKNSYTFKEKPELVADGIKVTATGKQDAQAKTITASVLHIGGQINIPTLTTNHEETYIFNTADKLCIACVGLGDSDMNRLWQMGLILIAFLLFWVLIEVFSKRRGAA